jgi:hypothetical protein
MSNDEIEFHLEMLNHYKGEFEYYEKAVKKEQEILKNLGYKDISVELDAYINAEIENKKESERER